MNILDALAVEYRRIDSVALWSDAEKAAAKAALRGVAVQVGGYHQFAEKAELPTNVVWLKLTEPALGMRGRSPA